MKPHSVIQKVKRKSEWMRVPNRNLRQIMKNKRGYKTHMEAEHHSQIIKKETSQLSFAVPRVNKNSQLKLRRKVQREERRRQSEEDKAKKNLKKSISKIKTRTLNEEQKSKTAMNVEAVLLRPFLFLFINFLCLLLK